MRRFNKNEFDCVEEAIKLSDRGNTFEAALMCKENNIPIDVAYRVIVTPLKRRSYPKTKAKEFNHD